MHRAAAILLGAAGLVTWQSAAAQPPAGQPPQWPKVDQATGPTIQKVSISARGAQSIVDSAVRAAIRDGKGIAIGVVDEGGNLVIFYRMDGVSLGTIQAVLNKARSSLKVEQPTSIFNGDTRLALGFASTGITVLNGGEPIRKDGKVVGAVAVSGGSPQDDDRYLHASLSSWAP